MDAERFKKVFLMEISIQAISYMFLTGMAIPYVG